MGPRGKRGWRMFSHLRRSLPVEGEFFPVYIPVREEISPSLLELIERFLMWNRRLDPHYDL
jgi:hypothetical protein